MDPQPGPGGRISTSIDRYGALASVIAASALVAAFLAYYAYAGRTPLDPAARGTLLAALFVADAAAFVVASSATLFILYLSRRDGSLRGLIEPSYFAAAAALMLAPLALTGSDLAFQPAFLADHGVFAAVALTALAIPAGAVSIGLAIYLPAPEQRVRRYVGQALAAIGAAGEDSSAIATAMQRPLAPRPALDLLDFIKRAAAAGDAGPAATAIALLEPVALATRGPEASKPAAAAGAAVSHIAEIGSAGAAAGSWPIVNAAAAALQRIASASPLEPVASAAFRGLGATASACMKSSDAFPAAALDPWLASLYLELYDQKHQANALEKARTAAERALALKGSTSREDRVRALHAAAQVSRRLAGAEGSEARARDAIGHLEEALKCDDLRPLDRAFLYQEMGNACLAMASIRGQARAYKRALASFEEAAKALTPEVSRYDAARLDAGRGDACALLADQQRNAGAREEALAHARGAVERYAAAARYFTEKRSPLDHSRIMANAGLAHTIISDLLLQSRDLDGALEQARLGVECYRAGLRGLDRARMPESFAALKVSLGGAYVNIAETCFKEQQFDEAVAACDSAIAAYNEALRVYESSGSEKLAGPARRHLQQANDLFNTFLLLGSKRPAGEPR